MIRRSIPRVPLYNPIRMNAPMVGSWSVEVRASRPYTIHGDLYYELHVVRTDEESGVAGSPEAADRPVLGLRVPQHATDGPPQPGDRLHITFLMGQVTSAKKHAGT